jgi:cyclophilin family peptidyl-prolyl cis-trans isomerase
MKRLTLILIINLFLSSLYSQTQYSKVVLETTSGKLVLMLYDDTPFHSENFTKLVNEGYYNKQLFHRVIKDFMIQSGDPDSKNAKPHEMLGRGGPLFTIPAEFVPDHIHKRGALAAARQPDNINPEKESSGSQFYIVQGKKFTDAELMLFVQKGMHLPFTSEQLSIYKNIGGSPHLDYSYTVFGELIEGFDVLDSISKSPVDANNRPINDIRIIKAYTIN